MKRDRTPLIFGALVVVVLGISLLLISRNLGPQDVVGTINGEFPSSWFAKGTDDELAAQVKLLGKPMPPMNLTQWQNSLINPQDLSGKVVILDFWATWCAPCIAAIPQNNALYETFKPKGLEFIGICTSTGQENFLQIITDKKPEYPVARDDSLAVMKAWNIQTYPLYAVIDRKGNVRVVGLKHESIEKVVEKLLSEPMP